MRRVTARHFGAVFLAVNLVAVAEISILDSATPAGVVVGLLLVLPILLSSISDRRRDVWITFLAAVVGFLVAAWLGRGPISPRAVWVPNRIIAGLSLPGGLAVALLLQGLRRRAVAARNEALRSSDLNRLLVPLLAHDLRTPLGIAIQMCDYLGNDPPGTVDRELISDVETRLRRSLRTIDSILNLARGPVVGSTVSMTGAEIASELQREVIAYTAEARARGKSLHVDIAGEDGPAYALDPLIPRQSISILVDNAIRHASPGEIRATGTVAGGEIVLRVEDQGPEFKPGGRGESGSAGVGLGLTLCQTLVRRAGGDVELVSDEHRGKAFVLRLPLSLAAR